MSTTQVYRVTGMDCADCAKTVQRSVTRLNGVEAAEVDFTTCKLRVTGTIDTDTIRERLEAVGYGLEDSAQAAESAAPTRGGVIGFWDYLRGSDETRLALIGGGLIVAALFLSSIGVPELLVDVLLVVAVVAAGYPLARSGWNAVRINHEFNINALMTIAALGALIIGQPLEAATVLVLFAIGEALEGYSADRARDSLRSLMKLAPATAVLLKDGHESTVPVSSLFTGDVLIVKPGERIPMDGTLIEGRSAVDQAPITGESIPVDKQVGDTVYAGTVNGSGLLKLHVDSLAEDNTLSRIIHMVEEAQSRRAPSQRMIDRFARVYTPAVVLVAAVVALVPPILFAQPFWDVPGEPHGWLYRALSLLVIACPCALVISAPVTVISGITRAARQGVLIKGGVHLEALAGVKVIAFDKTGTLTQGKPQLITTRSAACATGEPCEACEDVLALAAAVEVGSTHPLARAVVSAAQAHGVGERYPAAGAVEVFNGRGVRGQIGDQVVTVGSHALFDEAFPHPAPLCDLVKTAEASGQTTLMLSVDGEVRGYMSVLDTARPESSIVIDQLKQMDITTAMLTGDNATVAQAVAAQSGIDDVRAGLLPTDKVTA
ncbi:MAG: cation-translocating P-type ATPase, partial [Anaerolineae bacterium]